MQSVSSISAKTGRAPCEQHGLNGGDVGEGRHDDLVAVTHAARGQHGVDGGATTADSQPVLGATELGHFGLEILGLPVALALRIVVEAEQDAAVEDVHHFVLLFLAEKLCAGHG
jgi:hypothetical protein